MRCDRDQARIIDVTRESYKTLSEKAAREVREILPWDLKKSIAADPSLIVLDVRERSEFDAAHIPGSRNVPRGILEAACEYDYAETEPDLVAARARPIVVVCRSGNRSALAAVVLRQIGYTDVASLRLGVKGWNDGELPLVDCRGLTIDPDDAAHVLEPHLSPDQIDPARRKR